MTDLILTLIGAAASEVRQLTSGTASKEAGLSQDFIIATQAVLAEHAKNVGVPIEQVIAQL